VRHIILGLAAVLLLIPTTPATIAGAATPHLAQSTDFSAAKKKKAKMRKAKKEQYMRAVPSK
jgi:hypothetical protein